MAEAQDEIEVEVLLKPPRAGRIPDVATIAELKPDPGDIERCRRWFAARGLAAHATDFGLVCSGPKARVEELFGARLVAANGPPGEPPYAPESELRPPAELADLIESVTLPGRPILFG